MSQLQTTPEEAKWFEEFLKNVGASKPKPPRDAQSNDGDGGVEANETSWLSALARFEARFAALQKRDEAKVSVVKTRIDSIGNDLQSIKDHAKDDYGAAIRDVVKLSDACAEAEKLASSMARLDRRTASVATLRARATERLGVDLPDEMAEKFKTVEEDLSLRDEPDPSKIEAAIDQSDEGLAAIETDLNQLLAEKALWLASLGLFEGRFAARWRLTPRRRTLSCRPASKRSGRNSTRRRCSPISTIINRRRKTCPR